MFFWIWLKKIVVPFLGYSFEHQCATIVFSCFFLLSVYIISMPQKSNSQTHEFQTTTLQWSNFSCSGFLIILSNFFFGHPLSTPLDKQKYNGRDNNPLILDHLDHNHDLSTDSAKGYKVVGFWEGAVQVVKARDEYVDFELVKQPYQNMSNLKIKV